MNFVPHPVMKNESGHDFSKLKDILIIGY